MKNITAQNYTEFYWWIDTDFHYGDFTEPKIALYCMEKDEDGCKDTDTEERILWAAYSDIPGCEEAGDDPEKMWEAVDAYIMSELGYVPDYDIN